MIEEGVVQTWWHILKSTKRFSRGVVQATWDEERAAGIITAGYGNAPNGPGRAKLAKLASGDRVLIYAPGFGAVGVGYVDTAEPEHEVQPSRDQHAHRLGVAWRATIESLDDAITPAEIRDAGGYIPRTLATRINSPAADVVAARIERAAARIAAV